MGNICFSVGNCCNTARSSISRRKSAAENPFTDPSPIFPNERSGAAAAAGYHHSLAKMNSAPSSSVVGINTACNGAGLNVHHHFIASSEANLASVVISSSPKKSFRIPPLVGGPLGPLGRSGSHKDHGCEAKMSALFDKYRDMDPENNNSKEDLILTNGTEALCSDLELKPDDFKVLVFAWKCNAEKMCHFTRPQFLQGCRSLKADTIKTIQARLPEAVAEIMAHNDLFRNLYRYTYRFGIASSTQPMAVNNNLGLSQTLPLPRHLPLDMALILWQLVFSQRVPPILSRWLNFLEIHQPVRAVSMDTWDMFLPFAQTVDRDLSGYDENEAWPSLFDDFVEFETDQTNQNYEVGKPFLKPNQDQPLGLIATFNEAGGLENEPLTESKRNSLI